MLFDSVASTPFDLRAGPLLRTVLLDVAEEEQVLLFLNRRGYAPLTLCRACGHRLGCPSCTAWLVVERDTFTQEVFAAKLAAEVGQ